VLVADLLCLLERLAPTSLAQPGDNCGLLVGDAEAPVQRILVALELTEPVFREALLGGYDCILTHHPLLYAPVRSLVESRPKERLLRWLVAGGMTLIACHTNLDAASGGLADIAGEALGLEGMRPLEPATAGWYKLVGFIPEDSVETVAAAVFGAGAGGIGEYEGCAFASQGTGWFTAGPGSHPTVGEVSRPERVPEVRWETVVPRARVGAVLRAFVEAHPYEEPAFDLYPLEDVLPRVGLGRVGVLPEPVSVAVLAETVTNVFGVGGVTWSGKSWRLVQRVGVLPGSGRGSIDNAARQCEALVTGDLTYHDAEKAEESGLALVNVPHGELEWWAFKRWSEVLAEATAEVEVTVTLSSEWCSPWGRVVQDGCCGGEGLDAGKGASHVDRAPALWGTPEVVGLRMWIDGGSRGNPGAAAIGVVMEDSLGNLIRTISRTIGTTTNNVAEYRALLAGLEAAEAFGTGQVEVLSDSELLVRQMRGEYKVKNEGLKPLHAEARERAARFTGFSIRHVRREENAAADQLVNKALDEQERAGL